MRPATSGYGNAYVVHDSVLPVSVPGPEIVFQPTDGLPGSYIATYVLAAAGSVAPVGNVSENAGVLGQFTFTSGVTLKYASGVSAVPPIVRGRRRIDCTVGVPAGWPAENTTVRCATALEAGQLAVPVSPGPTGPREMLDDAVVLVVSVPVALAGLGTGVGDGVGGAATPVLKGGGDVAPPLHPAANADKATIIKMRRNIRSTSGAASATPPSARLPNVRPPVEPTWR